MDNLLHTGNRTRTTSITHHTPEWCPHGATHFHSTLSSSPVTLPKAASAPNASPCSVLAAHTQKHTYGMLLVNFPGRAHSITSACAFAKIGVRADRTQRVRVCNENSLVRSYVKLHRRRARMSRMWFATFSAPQRAGNNFPACLPLKATADRRRHRICIQ